MGLQEGKMAPASVPLSEPARDVTTRPRWRLIHYMTVCFLIYQVAAAITLRPGGHFGDVSDTGYYSTWGLLSYRGAYPYLHYWVEYPPVVPWLAVLVYRLTAWVPRGDVWGVSDIWFRLGMSTISALASTGALALVYRLSRLCWHSERWALRSAMGYALAYVPLYVMLGHMDVIPVFLLLLALDLTLRHRSWAGGVAAGVGILTKLYPGVVLLAALESKGRWKWVAACAVTVAALLAPFAILAPEYLLASGQAMLSRHSWETVWALLRGYYSYGTLSGDHFDPAAAQQGASHPWVYYAGLVAAATACLSLCWRGRHGMTCRQQTALAGFAVMLMLLLYSGYSPQFAVWVVPFVVVLLPNRRGVYYLSSLAIVMLGERVLYFIMAPESQALLVALVALRSLLYGVLALDMLHFLVPLRAPRLPKLLAGRCTAVIALASAVLLLAGASWVARTQLLPRYRALNRMAAVLDSIEAFPADRSGVVVTSEDAFAYVRPYLPGRDLFLVTYEDYQPATRWQAVSANLGRFIDSHRQVWLLLDASIAFNADLHRDVAARTSARGYVAYERWYDNGVWAGCYAMGEPARWRQGQGGDFDGGLELATVAIEEGSITGGDALRLRLSWRAAAAPAGDLNVFVHLLGVDGTPVAQTDLPLADAGWASGSAGATAEQRLAVIVPGGVEPGSYALVAGVYSTGTGERLALADSSESLTLGTVTVTE